MKTINFERVEVAPCLPNYFRPDEGDPIPDDLIGATIIGFGGVSEARAVPGGGLVIDYRKPGESVERRVVLAFNDTAMWVANPSLPAGDANPG